MNYLHLEKLAAHLASTGILCLRFTCRTRNFQYRKECFTAVVVSCNEIRSMFLPFVFWLSRRVRLLLTVHYLLEGGWKF